MNKLTEVFCDVDDKANTEGKACPEVFDPSLRCLLYPVHVRLVLEACVVLEVKILQFYHQLSPIRLLE